MKVTAVNRKPDPIPAGANTCPPSPGEQNDSVKISVNTDIQQVTSELFTRFVRISAEQIDSEIVVSMRRIVVFLGLDRGFLSQCTASGNQLVCTHCWSTQNVEPLSMPQGSSPVPWVHHQVLQGRHVCFSTPGDLPEEAAQDREFFRRVGTKSHVTLPLHIDGKVIGSITLESTTSERICLEEIVQGLKPVADVLAIAVERKRRKLELLERIRFETLISDLSARFVTTEPVAVDSEIELALERIGDFFGCDRCGMLTVRSDQRVVRVSHAWYADGIARVPGELNLAPLFPWAYDKLVLQGQHLVVSSLAALPPEAEKDRRAWAHMGVLSSLTIPVFRGKEVSHLLTIQNMIEEHAWDERYIQRLRLLGEIFAGALMRKDADEQLRKSLEENLELKNRLQVEAEFLRSEIKSSRNREDIIGQSAALAKVMTLVGQVAPTDSTVLICGETGTGKELVARAIHDSSLYRDKVMVKVNCASLPAPLVESELFGREKGAYTGALTRQIGRFELADNSTIFLDEIAELPLELQAKLLRVLQENRFERLGSPKTIQVHVRVIAATNRNLFEEVRQGKFREDLFYRLNVFPIFVPPLRERTEDIPLLVWAFVNEFCEKMGKQVHKIAKRDMDALQQYSWPGNIRELRNVIEHAVIVSTDGTLQVQLPQDAGTGGSRAMTLEEVEYRHIMEVLRRTGGRIKGEGGAARILGMIPSTLNSRIKKLGVRLQSEKGEISS
jgi:transcriptional regulator with GAF, ATPase, and Fis domain